MDKDFSNKGEYLDFIDNQWKNYCSTNGYIQEQPVKITSRLDPSVALIGATISPLKKYILSDTIGERGRFMIQPGIRTQVLKTLKTQEPQTYGSYFKTLGVLNEYSQENLEKVVFEALDYLIDKLNIPLEDVRVRICSQDKDLLDAVNQFDEEIVKEVNTFDISYYRHKYGLDNEGILGRNFAFVVRTKDTDTFKHAGNVIIMESDKKKHAIEMGFGNGALSMAHFGLQSTIQCTHMADIYDIDSMEQAKLADAIITIAVLQNEGITKDAKCSRYFRRLISGNSNSYGDVINYWKGKLQVDDSEILDYMQEFIVAECANTEFKAENSWEREQ